MADNDFLPDDYKAPGGNYTKLEPGENRLRILSRPIVGWIDWKEKKPLRFHMNEKPSASVDPDKPIKHFWAMTVWDYRLNKVAVFEVTQKSIQNAITALSKSPDWGSPVMAYDIVITKSGSGLDTEYMTNPVPPKPLPPEVVAAIQATPVTLDALFEGKDPFDTPF